MRSLSRLLILAALVFVLAGCGSAPAATSTPLAPAATSIPTAPTVEAVGTPTLVAATGPVDYTGDWDSSEWGGMTLQQDGNRVTGTYVFNDGQLDGMVSGAVLTFHWWEEARGEPFEQAAVAHRGDGHFTMLAGSRAIAGDWRYEGSDSYTGNWHAVRR